MVIPISQWFGRGFGQSGSTSNMGASTAAASTLAFFSSTEDPIPSAITRKANATPIEMLRFMGCSSKQHRLQSVRHSELQKPYRLKPVPLSYALLLLGPQNALFFLRDGTQAFVHEFLEALAAIGFRRVDVALGIRGDAVHRVELSRLTSAVAETCQDLQRVAQQNVDLFVGAVRQVNILLLGILRESNVPDRAVAQRSLLDDLFLDERAVLLEHLNAIVHTV